MNIDIVCAHCKHEFDFEPCVGYEPRCPECDKYFWIKDNFPNPPTSIWFRKCHGCQRFEGVIEALSSSRTYNVVLKYAGSGNELYCQWCRGKLSRI